MKQESNPSKKAIVKLLALSVIIIFSFKTTHAQLSPKWTSFSIEIQNKNILKLSWSVNQQKNNKEYIIQRSSDLKNWEVIGQIKNLSGENTADYSFNDKNLYEGMNYYRIQQKDIYGNISYSVLKVFDNSTSEWAYFAKNKAD
jgi:hypothetical protein